MSEVPSHRERRNRLQTRAGLRIQKRAGVILGTKWTLNLSADGHLAAACGRLSLSASAGDGATLHDPRREEDILVTAEGRRRLGQPRPHIVAQAGALRS